MAYLNSLKTHWFGKAVNSNTQHLPVFCSSLIHSFAIHLNLMNITTCFYLFIFIENVNSRNL